MATTVSIESIDATIARHFIPCVQHLINAAIERVFEKARQDFDDELAKIAAEAANRIKMTMTTVADRLDARIEVSVRFLGESNEA